MRFLLQFSGEHDKLPRAELTAVLEAEGHPYSFGRVFRAKRMVLADIDCPDASFLARLAYTSQAHQVHAVAHRIEPLADAAAELLADGDTFEVRAGSQILERRLGALVAARGHRVDFEHPSQTFSVFAERGICILGVPIPLARDFEARKPQHRPFFHPTSMHPKLARGLVNLARVSAGGTVLDPFAGTGGILVEAGLVGCRLLGWDIRDDMVAGCAKNLGSYGLSGIVEKKDALVADVPEEPVAAVVTDPPYGRGSYSSEENPLRLYEKFLARAHGWLAPGGSLVAVFPQAFQPAYGAFRHREHFDVYIHKSLTRRIWVLEKRP